MRREYHHGVRCRPPGRRSDRNVALGVIRRVVRERDPDGGALNELHHPRHELRAVAVVFGGVVPVNDKPPCGGESFAIGRPPNLDRIGRGGTLLDIKWTTRRSCERGYRWDDDGILEQFVVECIDDVRVSPPRPSLHTFVAALQTAAMPNEVSVASARAFAAANSSKPRRCPQPVLGLGPAHSLRAVAQRLEAPLHRPVASTRRLRVRLLADWARPSLCNSRLPTEALGAARSGVALGEWAANDAQVLRNVGECSSSEGCPSQPTVWHQERHPRMQQDTDQHVRP